MAKIVAFANQKGGVGKTTTCVNLSAALTLLDQRILLVDCDPQGNATSGMGVKKNRSPNIYDLMIRDVPCEECIVSTPYGDVLPSGRDFRCSAMLPRSNACSRLRPHRPAVEVVFLGKMAQSPQRLEWGARLKRLIFFAAWAATFFSLRGES